ncbi:MAG: pyridoxamine 5'-phosphate oxidase family protein [Anaerolineae bacterium]|nr:pyridoxamine 5'-phosphate oxidase family protein [Anaerolineae bacterium]
MAKFYDTINDERCAFIEAQHMFFVASAPLAADGHVNLSPKGMDTFRVLGPNRVAYADLTGSGNETSAHLLENGRVTIMFCAFEGTPRIMRLFGRGTTALPGSPLWDELSPHFNLIEGTRQIIVVDVMQAQTSCGYGVPLYEYQGERDYYFQFCDKVDVETYQQENNHTSQDGLPTPLGLALKPTD